MNRRITQTKVCTRMHNNIQCVNEMVNASVAVVYSQTLSRKPYFGPHLNHRLSIQLMPNVALSLVSFHRLDHFDFRTTECLMFLHRSVLRKIPPEKREREKRWRRDESTGQVSPYSVFFRWHRRSMCNKFPRSSVHCRKNSNSKSLRCSSHLWWIGFDCVNGCLTCRITRYSSSAFHPTI